MALLTKIRVNSQNAFLVKFLFLLQVLLSSSSSAFRYEKPEYIDLSYVIDDSNIFFPGQRYEYDLMKDVKGFDRTDAGASFWYASYSFCMGEHGGTHVDAPFHFNKLGWKLSEIPLERMADVPAAVIDVERYVFALSHPDEFALEVRHIMEHEAINGPIPRGAVILVRTGWSRFWPDKEKYMGTRLENGNMTLNFPGLSGDAAKWLLSERNIVGVGIDTASIDVGNYQGNNPICHRLFGSNQVYMIENVANIDYLVKKMNAVSHRRCNLHLFVLPIKSNGTGGVSRILAYCKG
ncbi:Kynurenine formamidase [Orchesella cincta]|uniref:Kynurenine formamidase n=1 Tax=Orchesella cincta TaxID=48709 RepID=A0A1D2M453_ORCCI|nr:Kynurenine formamidase [Orchesella cincta]